MNLSTFADDNYCVVATEKDRSIRHAVSGPMGKKQAQELVKTTSFTKHYIYAKVAKWPYEPRKHGG